MSCASDVNSPSAVQYSSPQLCLSKYIVEWILVLVRIVYDYWCLSKVVRWILVLISSMDTGAHKNSLWLLVLVEVVQWILVLVSLVWWLLLFVRIVWCVCWSSSMDTGAHKNSLMIILVLVEVLRWIGVVRWLPVLVSMVVAFRNQHEKSHDTVVFGSHMPFNTLSTISFLKISFFGSTSCFTLFVTLSTTCSLVQFLWLS